MAWTYLLIAGILELGWAIGLKYTEGFSKLWSSIFTIIAALLSFYTLSLALKTLPVGTGYAVWTGIGTVGTAILGIILFNEAKDPAKIICLVLIVSGILGLRFTSAN
mgnify:CR=1 FL=1